MSVSIIGNKCCACKTCMVACPVAAVKIVIDSDGYEQIAVDDKVCIQCGLCEKVCPILSVPRLSEKEPLSCGAVCAKNEQTKYQGSSGGLFGVLAYSTFRKNGVVYGAAFDELLNLKTTRVEKEGEIAPLFKSKYLLCDTGESFKNIKLDLDKGREVLYCSSPCQIAALRNFIKKEYANLLTVEFVCHGIGPQSLFTKSIDYIQRKKHVNITHYEFRFKKNNASSHYYYYYGVRKGRPYYDNGLYLFDPYYNAYCKQWVCREECYRCPYAQESRAADITIGDFHNINHFIPKLDRFKGISMFRVNSTKGSNKFAEVCDEINVYPFEWKNIRNQNRFHSGGEPPKERQQLLKSVKEIGFDATARTLLNPYKDYKRLVYYHLPSWLRKIIVSL